MEKTVQPLRRPFSISSIDFISVMDHMDEGVIVTDSEGVIHYYNETQGQIDGFTPDEVIGRKITDMYEICSNTSIILLCMKTGQSIRNRTFFYKTIKGNIANTIHSAFPIFERGVVTGSICFVKDYKILRETTPIISIPEIKPRKKNGTRYTFADIIGNNHELVKSVKTTRAAADSNSPIMLIGETDTGKELFAQSIHNESNRGNKPYFALNCAAIPENLLEGLLFGTTKGAFTGAMDKPGILEQANGSTLFLDEVLSMPLVLQAKLLRVLQEKKVQRIGSMTEINLNLKIVSSVNRSPWEAIQDGELRTDLFYRIGVVMVRIPPLRERIDDLSDLVNHFIFNLNNSLGTEVQSISSEVMELFTGYHWPGNIRELEHLLEGALNIIGFEKKLCMKYFASAKYGMEASDNKRQGNPLVANYVNSFGENKAPSSSMPAILPDEKLFTSRAERERDAIVTSLTHTAGNVSRSAELLGISRQLLHYKMRKLGLNRKQFQKKISLPTTIPQFPPRIQAMLK
jgi:arginine utilization regulatory protein